MHVYVFKQQANGRLKSLPPFSPSPSNTTLIDLHPNPGVKGIVFDKDNTLTAPYVDTAHEAVADALERSKRVFGAEKLLILSNSAGTGDDPGRCVDRRDKDHDTQHGSNGMDRFVYHPIHFTQPHTIHKPLLEFVAATRIEKGLGIPALRHATKKPGAIPEVLDYFKGVAGADTALRDLCIVGDRLLTDVMWGNGCGMLTVHTQILTDVGDNKVASVVRRVEGRVGGVLGGRGWAAPPHPLLAKYLEGLEANRQAQAGAKDKKQQRKGSNGSK